MSSLSLEDLKVILPDIVDALPVKERGVLTALFWEQLSLGEIAEQAGVSIRTVGRIRDRAFKRIEGLTK